MGNIKKELGMSAFDFLTVAISTGKPVAEIAGPLAHSLDSILSAVDYWNARKVDQFINGINRDEKDSENFRKLLFSDKKKDERAGRIISSIFQMETERKVEYLSFAGINFSNEAKRINLRKMIFFAQGSSLPIHFQKTLHFCTPVICRGKMIIARMCRV